MSPKQPASGWEGEGVDVRIPGPGMGAPLPSLEERFPCAMAKAVAADMPERSPNEPDTPHIGNTK